MTDYQRPRSDGGARGGGCGFRLSVTSEAHSTPNGAALSDGSNLAQHPSDVTGGVDDLARRIHDAQERGRIVRQIILYGVTNICQH